MEDDWFYRDMIDNLKQTVLPTADVFAHNHIFQAYMAAKYMIYMDVSSMINKTREYRLLYRFQRSLLTINETFVPIISNLHLY